MAKKAKKNPSKVKKKTRKAKIVFIVSSVVAAMLLVWILLLVSGNDSVIPGMRFAPPKFGAFIQILITFFVIATVISVASLFYILLRKEKVTISRVYLEE